MKLHCLILGALLVLLLSGCGAATKASAIDLRTFVGCAVREFTFLARKPGCRGLRVTTDACWGRCETWEKSLYDYNEVSRAVGPLISNVQGAADPISYFFQMEKDSCWKPILEPPYIESHHRICTYNETRMVTVKLPKCAPDVDPFYTYPVAIRCDCDICSTATTECETY